MTPPKAALIVGAGGATGGSLARRFAREGYIACVTRRSADKRELLVQGIRAASGQAQGFGSDAHDEAAVTALVAQRWVKQTDNAFTSCDPRLGRALAARNPASVGREEKGAMKC